MSRHLAAHTHAVQALGFWQFRAIQLHGLVGGPQVETELTEGDNDVLT